MKNNSILIIDDDKDVLEALAILLEDEFGTIVREPNPNRLGALLKNAYDVILLDMNFSAGINTGNEGLFWLSKILSASPGASVIMMTAYGNISLAVEAIKRGAKDFVLKPWDNEKLVATIRANAKQKSAELQRTDGYNFIEGESAVMKTLQAQIGKVAATDASVLILGENGTGKEMVARELHRLSHRSGKTFSTVDLSSLPGSLFESELFGHKKGAFTDAKSDRKGRFESADGGTLFLDEIGNLPLDQQVKLLNVLQTREVVPVGANTVVKFDVRLLSATNADLVKSTEQGSFRQDLFYRVNTITLQIPPLRERGDDVLLMADYFLNLFSNQYKKENLSFTEDAFQSLRQYHWPGNVRELKHTIEKAVILSEGDSITPADLNLSISSKPAESKNFPGTLDELEKQAMVRALSDHGGNIVHAAKALGITRQTLYNKMKKYGI